MTPSQKSESSVRYPPLDRIGASYVAFAIASTGLALWMSLQSSWLWWVTGQLLMAITMIQWFAILHEAGHKTLFRHQRLNKWTAYLAGFCAIIPGDCWRIVHAKHHYWTGWQDLDLTTQTLVPRPLRGYERIAINFCWWSWIPLFATLYRFNNYWNLARLWTLFPKAQDRRALATNIGVYLALYIALGMLLGWQVGMRCFALSLFISFSIQDLLILSQHTHIPMTLAEGREVSPYAPMQQDGFTRSLIFPSWISRLLLINMDAHSLHHMYPSVPGYHLHRIDTATENSTPWWQWILKAKSVRGDVLLFQNRDETGFYF